MTLNPNAPPAQVSFPGGCKVFDIADPDEHGVVFATGSEVSEVKFADGRYRNIANVHLRTVGTSLAPADAPDRLDCPTENIAEPEVATVHSGQQAWARIKSGSTWHDWNAVGAAHVIGRTTAMRDAHTNKPAGRGYNAAFAAWARKFGFNDLDKGDRNRLFDVMDNLAKIEKWREKELKPCERLRLNHPSSVWRRWKAATAQPKPESEAKTSPYKKLQAEHMALIEERDRYKREVERGGGDLWSPDDRPKDIAQVMINKLGDTKFEKVVREGRKILKALKGAVR
jgi:hypothetical protein